MAATAARGLAGWFCYLWLGRLVSRRFALLSALVYMSLPYHLVVDLYLRTAYAELWAFVWLLVIRGVAPARLLTAAAAVALGLLLASVYLVPAVLLRDEVTATALISDHFRYERWFLGSDLLRRNQITFRSLLYQIGLLVICTGLAWSARHHLSSPASRRVLAAIAIGLVSLFMMTSVSPPLWDVLGPLQFVQFPWRFATLIAVALAGLVAVLLYETLQRWRQVRLLTRAGGLAAAGWLVVGLGLDSLWLARLWPDGSVGPARVAEATSHYPGPEWLPLEWLPRRSGQAPEEITRQPSSGEPELAQGIGTVRITGRAGPSVAMQIRAETDVLVVYPKFWFPDAAVIVDRSDAQPAAPYGPLGLVAFSLPEGRHGVLFLRRVLWEGVAGARGFAPGARSAAPLALDRRALRLPGRAGSPG